MFDGVSYDSAKDAVAGTQHDLDDQIAKIQPLYPRSGGRLLLVLPTNAPGVDPLDPQLPRDASWLRLKVASMYVDATAKALLASHLFDDVMVERSNDPPAGNQGRDFAIWRLGSDWYVRYLDHAPVAIRSWQIKLALWNSQVLAATTDARNGTKTPDLSFRIDISLNPTSITPAFMGMRYDDPVKFGDAVLAAETAEWAKVTTPSARLGGKALLVLATGNLAPTPIPNSSVKGDPQAFANINGYEHAYRRAVDLATAEGLGRSHLFDSVVIRSEDIAQPPDATGFDYVIFQIATKPLPWQVMRAGGTAHAAVPPSGVPDQWVQTFRDELRR